jgi:hypothetical protein
MYAAEAMPPESFSNINGVAVLDGHHYLSVIVDNPPAERVDFPHRYRSSLNGEDVASVVAQPLGSDFSPQEGNNIRQQQLEDFYHQVDNSLCTLDRHSTKLQYRWLHSKYQVHASNSNNYLDHPASTMSLSYESRTFMPDANYPQMQIHDPQEQEEIQHEHPRYPSPPIPSSEMNPYNPQGMDTTQEDAIENLPNLQTHEPDAPSPGRSKPIPKPDREITKGENGRFVCTWLGCTEEVRDFGRKCEWSKHMDKHDRPYKCPAEGCEKLPGFTYSGGLLRHEREVHGKHGVSS